MGISASWAGWQRERMCDRVLTHLSRQRVAAILEPGGVWLIEQAVDENDEGVREALRTCHMRGWVEILANSTPRVPYSLERGFDEPHGRFREAPVYRLTDSGWNQIRRTHEWTLLTFLIGVVTLAATIPASWLEWVRQ